MKLARFSIYIGALMFTVLAILSIVYLSQITHYIQSKHIGNESNETGYPFHFHGSGRYFHSIANNQVLLRIIIVIIWLVGSAILFLPPATRISRIENNYTDKRGLLVAYGIIYLLLFGIIPGLLLLVGANSDVKHNRVNHDYQDDYVNDQLPLDERVNVREEGDDFEPVAGYSRDNNNSSRSEERGDLSSRVKGLEQDLRDAEDRERRTKRRVSEDIEDIERSNRRKIRDLEDELESLRRRIK